MNATKRVTHTPGVWQHNGGNPPRNEFDLACAVWANDGAQFICTMDTDDVRGKVSPEEQHANARLIAAAPELLEAAKNARHILDLVAQNDPKALRYIDPKALTGLTAAIRKAEGSTDA